MPKKSQKRKQKSDKSILALDIQFVVMSTVDLFSMF